MSSAETPYFDKDTLSRSNFTVGEMRDRIGNAQEFRVEGDSTFYHKKVFDLIKLPSDLIPNFNIVHSGNSFPVSTSLLSTVSTAFRESSAQFQQLVESCPRVGILALLDCAHGRGVSLSRSNDFYELVQTAITLKIEKIKKRAFELAVPHVGDLVVCRERAEKLIGISPYFADAFTPLFSSSLQHLMLRQAYDIPTESFDSLIQFLARTKIPLKLQFPRAPISSSQLASIQSLVVIELDLRGCSCTIETANFHHLKSLIINGKYISPDLRGLPLSHLELHSPPLAMMPDLKLSSRLSQFIVTSDAFPDLSGDHFQSKLKKLFLDIPVRNLDQLKRVHQLKMASKIQIDCLVLNMELTDEVINLVEECNPSQLRLTETSGEHGLQYKTPKALTSATLRKCDLEALYLVGNGVRELTILTSAARPIRHEFFGRCLSEHLNSLYLNVTEQGLSSSHLSSLSTLAPNMTILSLAGVKWSDGGIDPVCNCTLLTSLSIETTGEFIPVNPNLLTRLTRLEDFSVVTGGRAFWPKTRADLNTVTQLPLRQLHFKPTGEALQHIASINVMTQLTSLDLSFTPNFTELSTLNLPQLEELNLNGCRWLTESSLTHFTRLRNLRILTVPGNLLQPARTLARSIPSLERLLGSEQ